MQMILSKLKAVPIGQLCYEALWFLAGFFFGASAFLYYKGYPPTIVYSLGWSWLPLR